MTSPTPFDRLQPVWDHILGFLTPSLPKPLSGLTQGEAFGESEEVRAALPLLSAAGSTSRGDIRASELACLMRTSTAFNLIAAPHLYRTVITDSFSHLTRNFGEPTANPKVESKAQLLRRIRDLHLEYDAKGTGGPTYRTLLDRQDHWLLVGTIDYVPIVPIEAAMEAKYIITSAIPMIPRQHDPPPFPNLRVLSLGAIFGGQDALWKLAVETESRTIPFERAGNHEPIQAQLGPVIIVARGLIENLFRTSPLRHYCQRGCHGPFSLPRVSGWSYKATNLSQPPIITVHANRHTLRIPAVGGGTTRWAFEQIGSPTSAPDIYKLLGSAIDETMSARDVDRTPLSAEHVDLDIYGSDHHMDEHGTDSATGLPTLRQYHCGPNEERRTTRKVEVVIAVGRYKSGANKRDVIKWRSSLDSPPCLACGWVFERERAGEQAK